MSEVTEFAIGDRVVRKGGRGVHIGTVQQVYTNGESHSRRDSKALVSWDGAGKTVVKIDAITLACPIAVAAARVSMNDRIAAREAVNAARRAKLLFEVKVETTMYGVTRVDTAGSYSTQEEAEHVVKCLPLGTTKDDYRITRTRVWIEDRTQTTEVER